MSIHMIQALLAITLYRSSGGQDIKYCKVHLEAFWLSWLSFVQKYSGLKFLKVEARVTAIPIHCLTASSLPGAAANGIVRPD